MRTCMLVMFCLFLFACKPSGDKPDISIFDKPVTPAAFALQQPKCMPPQTAQCGMRCYDPKTYCCCTNPNTGSQCVIAKVSEDGGCGDVCEAQCQ